MGSLSPAPHCPVVKQRPRDRNRLIQGREKTFLVLPCLQGDAVSVSPIILTSQGQGYGSRPHSCLFEPYKPLTLNTAQFVLHNLHHSKWLHLAPQAIRDTFLHPTPSLAQSVRLFLESWSGPPALVSSSVAPFRPLLGSLP